MGLSRWDQYTEDSHNIDNGDVTSFWFLAVGIIALVLMVVLANCSAGVEISSEKKPLVIERVEFEDHTYLRVWFEANIHSHYQGGLEHDPACNNASHK